VATCRLLRVIIYANHPPPVRFFLFSYDICDLQY
jgi:hypothetical protein